MLNLNKKIPSEDEKKRRDEQFAAFYDYCIEVTRRNFVKILRRVNLFSKLNGGRCN